MTTTPSTVDIDKTLNRLVTEATTNSLWGVLRGISQNPMTPINRKVLDAAADELKKRLGEPFTTELDGVFMELSDEDDITYYEAARRAYDAAQEVSFDASPVPDRDSLQADPTRPATHPANRAAADARALRELSKQHPGSGPVLNAAFKAADAASAAREAATEDAAQQAARRARRALTETRRAIKLGLIL